jgi:methionine-rich copper-binding protein CopC
LFVNAAANDYHLKTGSPAIDAGTASYNSMSPAPADFDGNARPGAAAYDIGAYEVPGADLVPPTIIAKGPSASATSVAISSAVTATFSEDITADSLIFVLKDGSNNIVNASVSYDTNTRVATLTPAAALNSSTTYTVTVSGAQDPSGNTMSPVTWTFTTAAPDTTRPTVTGKTPAANATGVAAGTKVTVTFSEAVQPDTITFVLKDANNNIVAASVSYDDATQTATLTPNVSLGYGATYTATVTAQDLANNAMAAPVSWSFSTVSLGTGPFSLFPSNPKPGTVDDSDTNSTEVGVKFYSDVAGTVTGVRFYKGSLNTGTHVGHLWDANGNLLGTVTFTGETASGWQTATFATPIAINANQIYVVSYLAPKGQYAEDDDYFDTTGVDSAPLHAPVSGGAYGVNGVYAYSTGNVFPTATYANANYYVDVVFSPGGTADTTPPSVTGQTPASGATSVAVTSRPTVTFSESVQAGTISFVLKDANNNTVAASVSYNDTTHTVTLTPTASLSTSATYTLKISGAKDQAGNVMSAPVSWTFTTAAAADTTPPTVSGKTPSNGATGTAITSKPTVTFSESVQQATISFVLKDANNNTIAGTVTYNDTSHKATFTPSASLAYSTTYTLTVSGAKDQAGNVMVGSVSWSFTTAAAPDTTPPTVTGKSPASGATGVAVAVDPTVTFSEAVQAGTISFVLKDGNNNTIAATVTYDANTHTATLSPTADLTASSTYTLTVSSATDTAGNVMSAPVSWSFTTAAASVATIGFNTPTISVNENAGTATIIVTRSGNTSNAVSVNFATSDGTAVAGVNYTAASGTLNFGVGETSKTFVVTVLDDGAVSDDLTVNLTLSSPTNGAVISGGLGTAQLTIVNTDTAPVVDPGVDATAVKVAYGSDGTLYLAYIDSAGNLNFQSEDTQGNWSAAQTIDAGVKSGSSFSLAVDPSGNPGIAYYDAVNGDLDYAHFNGSAWDVSLPDYYKTTGLTPSLTYMSNGQPLIAYYDSYYGQLRLANQVNSKWALFVVDSGNVGLNASISYDPVVNAYGIGYENVKTGALKYATYYRKNFRTSTIDATTTGGVSDISIKINPLTHNPAMSYFDVQHTQLGYAAYTGAWSVTRVTTARSQGQSSSLNFDASGQAEILYYTASYGAINKATVSNSLWSLTRVISGGAGFSEAVGPGGLDTICWVDGSGLEFLSV